MPMSRYEIRNEYSLADPELYRAADKDDPEALLEGVAMAGLVGVLRQLGDLAEFAAEIFHNLHEEMMATAARGHGLMIRVQQLETEVPSIERAFLSQTNHSSFFYHAGVDWHPNLQIDQNIVTQGDLPRFIMDSYEECRAPPRLFLLDKFDVAGAGACLKRYSDPSFFKVETSGMTGGDIPREKKIRKAKKKGPRWRNGETPEASPTPHTKLHQLFLEERVENGVSNPSRRANLKRRLNGFPFDSKTGKSYMEKLLRIPSPDHKVLHEVTVNSSSSLTLVTNDHNESGHEVLEVRPVSPDGECVGRKRRPTSLDREEIMLNPSMHEPSEVPMDDKICEIPNSYPDIAIDGISPSLDIVTGEKVIAVDAESKGGLSGYQSDDIASEVENYVDAPSTIESEMDTDPELRMKSNATSSHIKNQRFISDANEEHLQTRSSDSQSTGDSTISDEGNNSSTKDMSSFSSSDSPSTSAEKPQSEKFSAKGFSSADSPDFEMVDASSYPKTAHEDFPVDQHSEPVASDDTCTGTDAISTHRSDFEQLTSSLCSNESMPSFVHSDSEGVARKDMLRKCASDQMGSTLDEEEKKTNLVIDPVCSPSVSDFEQQSGYYSPRSSAGKPRYEPNGEIPWISTVPDIQCHTTDSSVNISMDLLHEDESDRGDENLAVNRSSALNGTSEMIFSENPIPGKMDDEFPKLAENSPSDYPDIAHNGDNIKSMVSKVEILIDELDNEDANVSSDVPNHFPAILEDSLGKKLKETSLANAQTVDAEENHSNNSIGDQISSENLIFSHTANPPDRPQAGFDAHEGDIIPEEETTVNESLEHGTPKSCEVVGLQATGLTYHVSPNDSEAMESSVPDNLEGPAGTSGTTEMDGINLCMSSTGQEVAEISGSADLKSLNGVHKLLGECYSEADKSNNADMASVVPAVSENAIIDDVCLPVGHDALVEENIHCFEDSSLNELENDKNCLSGSHRELGLLEEVGETRAATSGFETVFCNTINNNHPKTEVSDAAPKSHLDLEVDRRLEFVHATTIQSLVEPSGLYTEHEFSQRSGLGNLVSDTLSLPVDHYTEESIVREKIGLPPDQLDQELLHSGEISSELPPLLPINHQHMLDHDDQIGENGSASTFSLLDCQNPPSVSELPGPSNYGIDVSGYPKDPLGSNFPPSNPLSETNQINLTELPPLPPLPPVHWRMGKLQHAWSSAAGEMMKHEELFPQLFFPPINDASSSPPTVPSADDASSSSPSVPADDASSSSPTAPAEDASSTPPIAPADDASSSTPIAPADDASSSTLTAPADDASSSPPTAPADDASSSTLIAPADDASSSPSTAPADYASSSPSTAPADYASSSPPIASADDASSPPSSPPIASADDASSSPPIASANHVSSSPPTTSTVDASSASPTTSAGNISSSPPTGSADDVNSSTRAASTADVDSSLPTTSTANVSSSLEEMKHTLIKISTETASKEEKVENSCSSREASNTQETFDLASRIENKQKQLLMPTSQIESMSPAEEDGVANGGQTVKLPWPRNPLVDDVAALDKSKLRKVTERARPQKQKVDERDSLLEQIRTKSFNLKPATASRPSIRGPKTNLKVAAILEKANAIRQALAGSDEDDDSWE